MAVEWRDAYRSLQATPVVTAVAVLSLALGIGANTALFSIFDSLVLKTLPVREPGRLALLDAGSWTNPIWEQVRTRQDRLFAGAFAWSAERFDLAAHGETSLVDGAYASGGMFEVLGVSAIRGRVFAAADDVVGGGPEGPVAVVSYGFWQRQWGGASDVIGRRLSINHVSFTVVGVTKPDFFGPDVGRACDVVVPIGTEPIIRGRDSFLNGRSTWWLDIMARLKPGQTLDEANAALRGEQEAIRQATLPDWPPGMLERDYLHDKFTLIPASSGRSQLRRRFEQPLTLVLAVVGAVLMIACANIANLLLARATSRRRDFSVRLALGASSGRLVGQLLIESLMLAAAGAAFGLVVAKAGSALLVRQLSTTTGAVFLDLAIDWRVLAFTAGVSAATAVLFGVAPALGVTRVSPNESLKEQGRSVLGDRKFGLRNALVIAQVALSLVLVVAAGLFVRTFSSLMAVPLGFNAEPRVVVNLNGQAATTDAQVARIDRRELYVRLNQAAADTAGVRSAALSFIEPLSGQGWNTSVDVPGGTDVAARGRLPWVNAVTPGYFSTYGIRLVAGRDFAEADRLDSPPVVIVNEAFASRFFKGQSAVGRTIQRQLRLSAWSPVEVVGVVSDSVYRSLREGQVATMYYPFAQQSQSPPNATLTVALADIPRAEAERRLRASLERVDSRVAFTFRTVEDRIRGALAQERLVAILSGFFGGLALLLAGLGLYGVTSYSVARRRNEIGLRMALGADSRGIVGLVLRRVAWLLGSGVVAGAALTWWTSRFVAPALLFRLEPRDPTIFGAAVTILLAVGATAAWLPDWRAASIDPNEVLREG